MNVWHIHPIIKIGKNGALISLTVNGARSGKIIVLKEIHGTMLIMILPGAMPIVGVKKE